MKGLLRKEWYIFITIYGKNLILIGGLYAALVLAMRSAMLINILVWMFGFYVIGLDTVDRASGWECYARTLPVKDSQVVGARMLIGLAMEGATLVYGGILLLILDWMGVPEIRSMWFTLLICGGMCTALMGIMMPATVKWGAEKARVGFILILEGIAAGVFLIPWNTGTALEQTVNVLGPMLSSLPVWGPAAVAVFFFAGYLLACRIYRKKEF